MRATVERKSLNSAMKALAPAVMKGGNLAVLQGVRIDVAKTGVDLCCSNLDLTIGTTIDAPHSTPGSAVVPAVRLTRIVSAMAGVQVALEYDTDDNVLTVTSDDAVATLRCLDLDAWPKLDEPDGAACELDASTVELLGRIIGMASTDAERVALTGLKIAEGRAACTDSYRLGVVDGLPPELGPAVFPASPLKAALADGAGVHLTIGSRQASLAAGPTTWTVRLIEAEFPPYERLVHDPPLTLIGSKAALAGAVARVKALGRDVDKGVRLTRDGDKLIVSSSDPEVGSFTDTVPITGTFESSVGFNPTYLTDLLDALDGDEVELRLTDHLKPCVAKSGRLTLLLMPTRIPDPA